jgi:hypothetical protein
MKIYSQHYIKETIPTDSPIVLIVTDENPAGVTLTVKDNLNNAMVSFNLPKIEMIESLQYIINELKATL